jgi:hypothetical protein
MDLGQNGEIIILDSILTIFEANTIFCGSWSSSKNWFELEIEPPSNQKNLACLNW